MSIGDPFPNVGSARALEYWLGEGTAESRGVWMARAELEQIHGRMRAPWARERGLMLHVGRVRPFGYGWERAVVIGREAKRDWEGHGRLIAECRELGVGRDTVARWIGIGEGLCQRYFRLEDCMSLEVQAKLRTLLSRRRAQGF